VGEKDLKNEIIIKWFLGLGNAGKKNQQKETKETKEGTYEEERITKLTNYRGTKMKTN